jgi:hypothetical protein
VKKFNEGKKVFSKESLYRKSSAPIKDKPLWLIRFSFGMGDNVEYTVSCSEKALGGWIKNFAEVFTVKNYSVTYHNMSKVKGV